MTEPERSALASMRDCWIAGGAAGDLAPAAWRSICASGAADECERSLLAIAGQAFDVALRPAAPPSLAERPPLPRLALPMLDERLRPLFRMALRHAGYAEKIRVAALAASRGYVAHPLDFMPSASDLDAPRVYLPWVDWQTGAVSTPDVLTAETWGNFFPATRRLLLFDVRKADPAAARALLEAKIAAEPAEVRVALIGAIRVGLSADDTPFIRSLSDDRSAKVRLVAGMLLGLLGEGEAETAAELAGFVERSRTGILGRRTVYTPLRLKTAEQHQRRAELFAMCRFADLAKALDTDEAGLVEGWQFGTESVADEKLIWTAAASASDEVVARLANRLLADGDVTFRLGSLLLPRLGEDARRRFVHAVLTQQASLYVLLKPGAVPPGTLGTDTVLSGPAYAENRALIAQAEDTPARRGAIANLVVFGVVASAAAAEAVIADTVAAGLAPADPALALLRFNAALGDPMNPARTP